MYRSVLKPHLSTGRSGNMLIIKLSWFWSVRTILFRSQIQNTKDRTTDIKHLTPNTGAWASAPGTSIRQRPPTPLACVSTRHHRVPHPCPKRPSRKCLYFPKRLTERCLTFKKSGRKCGKNFSKNLQKSLVLKEFVISLQPRLMGELYLVDWK